MGYEWVEKGIRRDTVWFEREIRDPLYRYIKLTNIENEIVDSRYFQRLANIGQMHSAHLVYPGAQYSRKNHSFGVMHLAHRIVTHILYQQYRVPVTAEQDEATTASTPTAPVPEASPSEHVREEAAKNGGREVLHPLLHVDSPFSDRLEKWKLESLDTLHEALSAQGADELQPADVVVYTIQATRLAGLLHDIGHGPMSHLLEAASENPVARKEKYRHEEKTIQIIERYLTRALDEFGGPYLAACDAKVLADIIGGKRRQLRPELYFLHEIVSSALDADKLDYVVRDAHHAGTPEYGTIDVDRIIDAIVVRGNRLQYVSESVDAVIEALNSMFFMYNNVYLHRTVRAFDIAAVEGLSRIHPELRALGNAENTEFFSMDDARLRCWVEETCSRLLKEADPKSEEPGRWSAARTALRRIQWREKTYKCIVDRRLSVPLAAIDRQEVPPDRRDGGEAPSAELRFRVMMEQLEKRLAKHVKRLKDETGVDADPELRKYIRPIGLGLEDVLELYVGSAFYNPDLEQSESFLDFEPHYKTMTKLVVPVRLFILHSEFRKISKPVLVNLGEEIRTEIRAFEADLLTRVGAR